VSPLYSDVRPTLASWRGDGLKLAIFSSGSVAAQKLFLTYTGMEGAEEQSEVKDLNPWFSGNFDTVNAGPKGEKESYEKIVKDLDAKGGTALFLSDNVNGM
jgi:enolase-phosphatase E1